MNISKVKIKELQTILKKYGCETKENEVEELGNILIQFMLISVKNNRYEG